MTGFAAHGEKEAGTLHVNEVRKARRSVLETLSRRPDGHRHEALSVTGLTPSQIELVVKLLRLDGLVNAVFVSQGTRPGQDSVWPSTLTAKGRSYLASLAGRPVA